ncbi:hypothetical protein MOC16_gp197 [Klebsiella phage vB_KpM_FBKp24]|uniref:Uncharacterized protein n=1 Tax=Klebsiella phage vB_KpM_FBKp24 TaxID=2801834 RepID=A0A7U0J6U2_9CAUD|nr:hypothetical protein [Klebsiella pneumoniae]YP_010298853.1 hypothetical protein MOC16_gp197 [Klebsiella phage vB_KpM_FBKp24]QQV92246.1 hypothetical protein vBKpMFBKp24_216 [Klebsiella phage vB_KpM_FBKp24]
MASKEEKIMNKVIVTDTISKVRKIGKTWTGIKAINITPFVTKVFKEVDRVPGVKRVGLPDSLVVKIEGLSGWFLIREDFLIPDDPVKIAEAIELQAKINEYSATLDRLFREHGWSDIARSRLKDVSNGS